MTYIVGCDLGQVNDFTAITVLSEPDGLPRPGLTPAGMARPLTLRHLERLRGVSYPAIVAHVTALLHAPAIASTGAALVVDATGVGRAVTDMFRQAQLSPVAVTIHGGDAVTRDVGGYRVPKRDLVAVVQVALQNREIRIADALELAPVLRAELAGFRVTINPATAHDSYAAWREGQHDDLVLSTALAIWWARRRRGAIGYAV